MVTIHGGMMVVGNIIPLKQASICNTDQLNAPAARSVFTKLERKAINPVKKIALESSTKMKNKIELVLMSKRMEANSQEITELRISMTVHARLFPSNA